LGRSATRDSVQVVQGVVDDVRVRLDGEAAWSETTVSTAGPWALTLITVMPDLGVRLISSYLGGEHVATGATHVLTHPGEGELVQREHRRDALPVTHARERCLLDHGAELQRALVAVTGMHVAVDVPAAALAPEPH
jgi:hypothetical protein